MTSFDFVWWAKQEAKRREEFKEEKAKIREEREAEASRIRAGTVPPTRHDYVKDLEEHWPYSDPFKLSPIMELPSTRIYEHLFSFQSTPCRHFERAWHECAAPVGLTNGRKLCRSYYNDMIECVFQYKQNKRIAALNKIKKETNFPDYPPIEWDAMRDQRRGNFMI